MKYIVSISIFLHAALLLGCDKKDAPAAGESKPVSSASASTPASAAAVASSTASTAPVPSGMQALAGTLASALETGAAAQQGGPPCESAYDAFAAMRVELEKQMGGKNDAKPMPKKEEFVKRCRTLPEKAQQCLLIKYALEHQAECAALKKDPKVAAATKSVMGT